MKLSNLILKAIFIISIISILLAFIVSIFFQYNSFKNDRQYIKNEFIKLKKEELQREVLKVHSTIKYKQAKKEQEVRKKLKNRVHQAHNIATSIYEEYKEIRSETEIQNLIIVALKNISYNEKRSYFFINSNKGQAILFNKKPTLHLNKNIWDLKDVKGNYIIRRQSNIALNKEEGFVTNYFIKPDLSKDKQYPKLSYIKNFKPFNWHIGIGTYLDDMLYQTKQDILNDIAKIRFGENGYIFVNSLDKKALVFDGNKLPKPKVYSNDKLYKMLLDAQKKSNGDFLFYTFKKIDTTEKFPKIAFVKTYKEFEWIIGAGAYIDNIDNEITRREDILKNAILGQTNTIILFLLVIVLCIYLISKKISSYINTNILNLISSFKQASKNHKNIDTKKLSFKEFVILAKNLNKTLESRNKTEMKMRDYVKIVDDNIIISSTDTQGIMTHASKAFCDISGYRREELIGKPHHIVRHPDVEKEFYAQMWGHIQLGLTWVGEIKNVSKDGTTYWVEAIIQPVFEKNILVGYTAIRHDITAKKKVEYLSITDELTQLYNRRFFNTKIEEELSRAKREKYCLAFMMLDIDYFKKYNDTYGHQAGDIALQKISAVLNTKTNRGSDFAFRLGGEEFGIIFSIEDEEKALMFANLIKNEIENLKIKHEKNIISPYITASIGLVVKKGSQLSNSKAFYKEADEHLYKAKAQGRNCISC